MMGEEFQIGKGWSPEAATVRRALQEGGEFLSRTGIESARVDAELLLGTVMGWGREELYLNYEIPLKSQEFNLYQQALQRRGRREPISYITGQREFWSRDFFVTPDVLVPRPETEHLVEVALGLIEAESQMADCNLQILDLGTGSGAIAVSLAKERSDVEVWASDLSSKALEIARYNAERHGVKKRIRFLQGDIFEPVETRRGYFDMIVSNPPYVRQGEIQNLPPEVRDWEPRLAWDGGVDGLDLYRRIIQQGHLYLNDQGFMVLEIGVGMGDKVCRLLEKAGCYSKGSVVQDYAGRERVVVTRRLL